MNSINVCVSPFVAVTQATLGGRGQSDMIDTLSAAKSTANINTTVCAERRAGSLDNLCTFKIFGRDVCVSGCNQNDIVLVHLCACG